MSLPSREQIATALKSVSLFQDLEEPQFQRLAQHAMPRRAGPGEILFAEGDQCQGLYVIYSGAVRIFKQSAQGREQVLTIERAGGLVGELPVFDGGPHAASCEPTEHSVLLFLSKQDIRRCCREDPELALKVLASIGGRLRHLIMLVEQLSFLTVRNRLAALLLEIAGEGSTGSLSGTPVRVPFDLTQQEIAARVGTVRELVSRNMARLEHEGIIRLEGHTLVIPDLKRLEQEAHPES